MNILKNMSLIACVLIIVMSDAQALIIKQVNAPPLIELMNNSGLTFGVNVTYKYEADDSVNNQLTGKFWDYDFFYFTDDLIDEQTIVIPGGAGEATATFLFTVSCKNSVVDRTEGENPMDDGHYEFTSSTNTSYWGTTVVTCGNPATKIYDRTSLNLASFRISEPSALFLMFSIFYFLCVPNRRRKLMKAEQLA